jgi:hypothetical protein
MATLNGYISSTITTSNATGDYYGYPTTYPYYTTPSQWIIQDTPITISGKENENMRSLFKIYVVDPKGKGKLVKEETVIAKDQTQAQLKACSGLEDIEELDIIVQCLGQIREEKKPQEVKVV